MNKPLLSFIVGASFGAVLTNWFGPRLIAWYFEPPVEIGVNCRPAVDWALTRFQWAQGIGIGLGAVLGLIVFISLRSKRNTKPQQLGK